MPGRLQTTRQSPINEGKHQQNMQEIFLSNFYNKTYFHYSHIPVTHFLQGVKRWKEKGKSNVNVSVKVPMQQNSDLLEA